MEVGLKMKRIFERIADMLGCCLMKLTEGEDGYEKK